MEVGQLFRVPFEKNKEKINDEEFHFVRCSFVLRCSLGAGYCCCLELESYITCCIIVGNLWEPGMLSLTVIVI